MLVSHQRGDISRQPAMQDEMTIPLSCRCVDSLAEEGRLISKGTLKGAGEISTPSGHHHITTWETTKIPRLLWAKDGPKAKFPEPSIAQARDSLFPGSTTHII